VSPSGKAVDFDSAIRRFESCHPSFNKNYRLLKLEEFTLRSILDTLKLLETFKNKNMEAKIQFIKGLDEKVLPDVRLTRSRDGSTGTATFRFKNPNILDKNTAKEGEITGMYLIDEEGILETRDVNARFVNGKPEAIEAIYIMKSPEAWDRFMRFMERYGQSNGLVFTKAN
jgi:photosystem II protein